MYICRKMGCDASVVPAWLCMPHCSIARIYRLWGSVAIFVFGENALLSPFFRSSQLCGSQISESRKEEVRRWLQAEGFEEASTSLPAEFTGQMLVRCTPNRCTQQLCRAPR